MKLKIYFKERELMVSHMNLKIWPILYLYMCDFIRVVLVFFLKFENSQGTYQENTTIIASFINYETH